MSFKNDALFSEREKQINRKLFVEQATAFLANEVRETLERMTKTCLNCDNWDNIDQLCSLYKTLPPPKVLVVGCENHVDEIPF